MIVVQCFQNVLQLRHYWRIWLWCLNAHIVSGKPCQRWSWLYHDTLIFNGSYWRYFLHLYWKCPDANKYVTAQTARKNSLSLPRRKLQDRNVLGPLSWYVIAYKFCYQVIDMELLRRNLNGLNNQERLSSNEHLEISERVWALGMASLLLANTAFMLDLDLKARFNSNFG